ncbi:cell wall hydrolase [Rhodomicrobium vannielii ATCC 17100]|uniref:cell wall hydrolase n=1 Tax=Rhodomicrobium vannielii TaxID=1069 RepID=UPI001919CF84|nr:cell wall hydrolase [Rhodomicrobium vannielii]MBJ7533460.1 cell wall hydrolase [Rhodomicrobium vannielii ATCC 17100]
MRSSRPMTGYQGQSRALVSRPQQQFEVIRKPAFAVEAPRPVSLTLKARRSFAKLAGYTLLAGIFAVGGYAWRDPDVRRAIDYRVTMLTTTGVSQVAPTLVETAEVAEPLPPQAAHLFYDSQKGPRADKFAYALKAAGSDTIARRMKADPLRLDLAKAAPDPAQTAALASASLFMTAFAPREEAPAAMEAPPPPVESRDTQWAGLLKNASLSPEQPKTLFGGLTEDEFRARELRCMATAIYFEARDEPVKGQIAVAQVVMNRIRSPFYPKTICGVVYQGERRRTGCQFSFTCTGKRNTVKERKEWATAVKLSKQVIAGEVWLDDVGYATHYHATYVHPSWRHELIKITQIGGHIFYRMKPGTVQLALLSEGL